MSLNKNKGIKKIRKRLDSLDNKLLNIIKQRTKLVQMILSNKTSKKQIVDRTRIKIILKNSNIYDFSPGPPGAPNKWGSLGGRSPPN